MVDRGDDISYNPIIDGEVYEVDKCYQQCSLLTKCSSTVCQNLYDVFKRNSILWLFELSSANTMKSMNEDRLYV